MDNSPSPPGRGPGGGRVPQTRRKPRDAVLIARARDLRNGATEAERLLWSRLRGRQLEGRKFSRQIAAEGFIADFACRELRLIVELDGGQHGVSFAADRSRDAKLVAAGWTVLRFWNSDVFQNLDGVLSAISAGLGRAGAGPPPGPLPVGEGEIP